MTITSLNQLVDWLSENVTEGSCPPLPPLKLNIEDFSEYTSWNSEHYTRNCIVRTDSYELLAVCWDAKQASSIHCHDGQECWVFNIQGQMQETRYESINGKPQEISKTLLSEQHISFMSDDMGFHKLENIGQEHGLTLHLYVNPISKCTYWSEKQQNFVPIRLGYDSE